MSPRNVDDYIALGAFLAELRTLVKKHNVRIEYVGRVPKEYRSDADIDFYFVGEGWAEPIDDITLSEFGTEDSRPESEQALKDLAEDAQKYNLGY